MPSHDFHIPMPGMEHGLFDAAPLDVATRGDGSFVCNLCIMAAIALPRKRRSHGRHPCAWDEDKVRMNEIMEYMAPGKPEALSGVSQAAPGAAG